MSAAVVCHVSEQGDRARELGIYGASVGCVPFEPQLGAEKLANDPVGRFVRVINRAKMGTGQSVAAYFTGYIT